MSEFVADDGKEKSEDEKSIGFNANYCTDEPENVRNVTQKAKVQNLDPFISMDPASKSANRDVLTRTRADEHVFCPTNNDDEVVYESHILQDPERPEGRITCPMLRAYQCPICGEKGNYSHTVKDCPFKPEFLRWKAILNGQ